MNQKEENVDPKILSIPVTRDVAQRPVRTSRRQFKRQLEATGSQLTRLQITLRSLSEIVSRLGIEIGMTRQELLNTLYKHSEKGTTE
jgi:hypothetical protein